MSLTDRQIRDQVWKASWMTQGRAPTDGDYNYWGARWPTLEARGLELGDPEYAVNRLLGKGATGADVPPFGEYANPPSPYRSVPPSPWVDAAPPANDPPPSSPPAPAVDPPANEANALEQLLFDAGMIAGSIERMATAAVRVADALEQLAAKGVKVRL